MTQWIGGIHAVNQAIDDGVVRSLEVQKDKRSKNLLKLLEKAEQSGVKIEYVASYAIDYRVPGVKHQGVAAEVMLKKQVSSWQDCIKSDGKNTILILDGIQDPHNLGACLRSALAANVDAVLIPNSRSASITPTVHKVSCGASEILPIFQVPNLKREIDEMKQKGFWIIGSAGEAEKTLYKTDLTASIAIIMGNEGQGIRLGLKESCDYLVRIPISEKMESLNVSVACGVMLFEAQRQRSLV